MTPDLLGLIGAVGGVGIPAVMSLVAWLWTSREKDARKLLEATNQAQQKMIDAVERHQADHELRIRRQEEGHALKELRLELRSDLQRLEETVRQLGVVMQQAAATYASSSSAVQGELAGMREAHRRGDNPSSRPGG